MRILLLLLVFCALFLWLRFFVLVGEAQKIPRAVVSFLAAVCGMLFFYILILGIIQGF